MPRGCARRRYSIPKQVEAKLAANNAVGALSERQRQVLSLLGDGLGDKEIARALSLSPSRVGQHVRAIKRHLGAQRRSDLIVAARHFSLYDESTGQSALVPRPADFRHPPAGAVPDQVHVADAMPLGHSAPWQSDAYRDSPGAIDDRGETLRRLLLMVKVSLGIPALLALLIIARWAITAAATPLP